MLTVERLLFLLFVWCHLIYPAKKLKYYVKYIKSLYARELQVPYTNYKLYLKQFSKFHCSNLHRLI